MGASKRLKIIMLDKDVMKKDVAENIGMDKQILYNMLYKDNMSFKQVETIIEALGCEIVFRDKETGKEY